ncbi:MAG: phospho-N-acetylmuramoyl-pentapeptide-transferase [candidate division WOR-3 bacterium]
MLAQILYNLKDYFSPFNLFRYITFRAAYAGAFSLIFSLVFGKWFIAKLKKMAIGQNVREEVPQKHKLKTGTPTMGGILILFAIILGLLFFADLSNTNMLLGLFILITFGLLGFYDDYKKVRLGKPRGINKRTKIFFQVLFSLVVALVLYYKPINPEIKTITNFIFFKNIQIDFRIFYIPFVVAVILITSNAVNLADGLDGLASGLLGISSASYGVLAYVAGNIKIAEYLNIIYVRGAGEITVLAFAILGATLGFLWFNTFPAQIFMGDTGSLPLGAIIGFMAIAVKQEFLLIFVGGVFVLEALTVFIQVVYFHLTRGKRIFRMAPLHHHFELCGWQEPTIVVRFWILAILLAIFAISTLKIR